MNIGILGILQIIFITLKLAEIGVVATWSWWMVFLPVYTVVGTLLLMLILVGFISATKNKR